MSKFLCLRLLKLYTHMAAHGPIQKLELVRDTVTLESKGFSFVNFVTPADGSRCLRLLEESGGLWLDGKKVDISFAHDRTAMAPKPKAKACVLVESCPCSMSPCWVLSNGLRCASV